MDCLENPDERRTFNRQAELHGGPLLAMAAALETYGEMAPQQGSYAQSFYVMANEAAKAHATVTRLTTELAEARAAVATARREAAHEALEKAAMCVGILPIGPDGTENDERFYAVQQFVAAAIRKLKGEYK